MTDTLYCCATVFSSMGAFPCSRKGVIEECGNFWCRQHAPSAEEARREKSNIRVRAEIARRDRVWAIKKAKTEIVEMAIDLVNSKPIWDLEDSDLLVHAVAKYKELKAQQDD